MQGYQPQLWSTHQLDWSVRISPGKGRQHRVLLGKVVGCVGFQRKRDFFQDRPLLQPLYTCTLFSKQEPCSLSQASATISQARMEQLKATRALAMRGLAGHGPGQNTRFPTSHKQKSMQQEAHCKNTSASLWHNPQLGLGLGERAKTFPLINFKNSN